MNKGSIVEWLCSDLDRKEPRYKSPTLLYMVCIVQEIKSDGAVVNGTV